MRQLFADAVTDPHLIMGLVDPDGLIIHRCVPADLLPIADGIRAGGRQPLGTGVGRYQRDHPGDADRSPATGVRGRALLPGPARRLLRRRTHHDRSTGSIVA